MNKNLKMILLLALVWCAALYADTALQKLSSLPVASVANDADMVYGVQAGASKSITVGQIRAGYTPTTRTISTTSPLSGGGDLSANRTLAFSNQSANAVLAGPTSGGAAAPAFRALVEGDLLGLTTKLGAQAGKYSPDRKPSTCAACEEFLGGAESQSWSWSNQGSATQTLELDTSLISGPSETTNIRGRCLAFPAATNAVVTSKISLLANGPNGRDHGIYVIETGSLATPTAISAVGEIAYSTAPYARFQLVTKTSYSSAYTTVNDGPFVALNNIGQEAYFQARYVTATKKLTYAASMDGMTWNVYADRTLGADPLYACYGLDSNGGGVADSVRAHFFRIRTDATGTTSPFPAGS